MTDLQLELTKLIGSKELSFGCALHIMNEGNEEFFILGNEHIGKEEGNYEYSEPEFYFVDTGIDSLGRINEIIGHPATLSDLHRWIKRHKLGGKFMQENEWLRINSTYQPPEYITYDCELPLLEQSEDTLKKITDFIKSNQ